MARKSSSSDRKGRLFIFAHDAVLNISYFGGKERCAGAYDALAKAHRGGVSPAKLRSIDDLFLNLCVRSGRTLPGGRY
jgi:hypothetical protein